MIIGNLNALPQAGLPLALRQILSRTAPSAPRKPRRQNSDIPNTTTSGPIFRSF